MVPGPLVGFHADGYLGQYLVVVPDQRLVGVRMMREPKGSFNPETLDAFQEFPEMVQALVPSKSPQE
jgi:hypothetical protein